MKSILFQTTLAALALAACASDHAAVSVAAPQPPPAYQQLARDLFRELKALIAGDIDGFKKLAPPARLAPQPKEPGGRQPRMTDARGYGGPQIRENPWDQWFISRLCPKGICTAEQDFERL
jgi:hypothetical protein